MRVACLILTVLLLTAPGRDVRSDEGPDATEGARRTNLLRERVRRWVEARQLPAISTCRQCGGEGVRHRIDRDSRGTAIGKHDETCKPCSGRGTFLDWARARASHWDVRSPAYRASTANESAFKSMVNGWLGRAAEEPVLRRYQLGDVVLTGDRYGIVKLFENGDRVARDTRWVWAPVDGGKLGAWYLYGEATDGVFDGTPRTPPSSPSKSPSKPPSPYGRANEPSAAAAAAALADGELASLAKDLGGRSVKALVHSAQRADAGLVVRLRHAGLTGEPALQRAVQADIIPAMQASLLGFPTASSVSLVFLTCYRDALGVVALRPYETVRLDRATFVKIHFENLTVEEALRLFERERASYALEDVILWWKGSCGADASPAPPPPLAPLDAGTPVPAPALAVADALRWLATHQSPNGSWECAGFGRWSDGKPLSGDGLEGAGKPQYDVGVTGLALLAFLGAGYGGRGTSPFASTVERGLRYLTSTQDAEGCFGSRSTGHYVYNHAIATLAMLEGFDRTPGDVVRRSAQRGIAFADLARNPGFAWRYGVRPGDNDTSTTGWFAQALARARELNAREELAGRREPFTFDPLAFDGIRTWLDKMTDPDTGRVGYQQRGTGPARPQELVDRFPADRSESMTASAMLARLLAGETPRTSEAIRKGADLCAKLPPAWNKDDGSIDMYYWHHATAALRRVGGPTWDAWRLRMIAVAETSQRRDGTFDAYKGSWDGLDPWGADGGRVYATAMMTLCLEACGD